MKLASIYLDVGDDIQLHVMRRQGTGSKYVFLHGFGEGGFVWFPFARTLPKSADLYIIDLRGHGESSWHPTEDYSVDAYVGDLKNLFTALDLHEVILVGHSLGARVAITLTSTIPCDVLKLVLVDVGLELNELAQEKIIQDFMESSKIFNSSSEYFDFVSSSRPLAEQRSLKEFAGHMLRKHGEGQYRTKADPALVHSVERGEDSQELWEKLTEIPVETFLVRGAGSAVLSSSCASKIVSVMPRCEMVNIEIAGHGVMVDNPSAFAEAVNQFLGTPYTPPS